MDLIFVVNNLKVSPFLPYDRPIPGCSLLTYEHESYSTGSLYDLGKDAGFFREPQKLVRGQLWTIDSEKILDDLSLFFGESSGLTKKCYHTIEISIDNVISKVSAMTFELTKIPKTAKIINDSNWTIKRF